MTEASKVFSQALRTVAKPQLHASGFEFDGRRTFRRPLQQGAIVDAINFQLGQRWLQGQFTVNLSVGTPGSEYDPLARVQRLGLLIPPPMPMLTRLPVVGTWFGPKDIWWRFSADPKQTEAALRRAMHALVRFGYAWFGER